MLSIVTVSKGRHEIFAKVVKSIWENADDPYNMEHIVATDLTDVESHAFMEAYIKRYPAYNITHTKVRLPECIECSKTAGRGVTHYERRNIHKDYWNPIARRARGDVVFGLTNDFIIQTKGFDKIMLDAVDSHKQKHRHSYFQILIDDDDESLLPEVAKPFPFCSLIILTKEAVRIVNGIAPDEITFSGADQYMEKIFSHTLYSSQIDLRDQIKCEQISHYTGRQETADDVTSSRAVDSTNWASVGEKQYDLALDYAIIKQLKWVKEQLQERESFVKNGEPEEIEKLTRRLIDMGGEDQERGSWWSTYVGLVGDNE